MTMRSCLLLIVLSSIGTAEPMDDLLLSEIEEAAADSRVLADELAGMLARLELEESREQAVEAAVLGEEAQVEEALKEMVEKIEDLAQASEISNLETVSGLVKKKRVKEEELRKTLEQLEMVASQIEEAADSASSLEEVSTIEKIAKMLQSVSDKIEAKNEEEDGDDDDDDDEDEKVFRNQFGKDQSRTGLELNGIAEMIKSLEKVTNDLNNNEVEEDEYDEENGDSLSRQVKSRGFSLDATVSRLLDAVEGKVEESEESTNERPRGGKQLSEGEDFDYEEVFEEKEEEEEVEVEKESKRKSKEVSEKMKSAKKPKEIAEKMKEARKPKEAAEDVEECEEDTAEDQVRVCLPKLKKASSSVRLPSGKVEEERVCLDVARTVCNESSAVLSREVCTYEYKQKTVLAPVQSVQLTHQPRHERLGVTQCEVVREKKGYREVAVERCVMEYVEAPFTLPDLAFSVDDFLQLHLPEPEKRCTVFRYELPEVVCGEHTRHHCIQVAHLKPYQVTDQVDSASLDYGGSCTRKTLSQNQQICTTTKEVKRQSGYGRHSRY